MRKSSEPVVDDCDLDGGGEADGELVVAGRDVAVMFEGVDRAFDRVAVLLSAGVEGGRSAAAADARWWLRNTEGNTDGLD